MTTWRSTNTPAELPTFDDIRRRAYRELGDVLDTLRSDWRPGTGPTSTQATARHEAFGHLAQAKAALDRAACQEPDTDAADGW